MRIHPGGSRHTQHIWCAVPVYNNARTVKEVAQGCRRYLEHVLVVDDGSTDADVAALFVGTDITVISHEVNEGKGVAILTALRHVHERGARHMITIDADGQHDPADIARFIPYLQYDAPPADGPAAGGAGGSAPCADRAEPGGLPEGEVPRMIIGCRRFDEAQVPGLSRFGRRFANFWLWVEAGVWVDDCQSGLRSYPVPAVMKLRLHGARYEFETEVLAKAAWSGIRFVPVEVAVDYPEPALRVSSFDKRRDNIRIAGMHARLIFQRILRLAAKAAPGRNRTGKSSGSTGDPRRRTGNPRSGARP